MQFSEPLFGVGCPMPKSGEVLFYLLFEKGTLRLKQYVKNKIELHLKTKFNFDVYYYANLYEIIDFDIQVLNTEIRNYQVPTNKISFQSFFSGTSDFYHPSIDMIVNLAFKNKINVQSIIFTKISKINLYYKWLLNMEKYNYTQFDIKWALHHHTIYFLQEMSKSIKFKTYLRSYLNKKNHEGIERLLLRITNF